MSRNSGARPKKQTSVTEMVRSMDSSAGAGKRTRVSDGQATPPQPHVREDFRAFRTMFREEMDSFRRHSEESLSELKRLIEERVTNLVELIESKWERYEERLSNLEKHVEMKDEENEALHVKVNGREAEIHAMHAKLDDLEARYRRNTLVFSGAAVARRPVGRPRQPGARPGDLAGGVERSGSAVVAGGEFGPGESDVTPQGDVSSAGAALPARPAAARDSGATLTSTAVEPADQQQRDGATLTSPGEEPGDQQRRGAAPGPSSGAEARPPADGDTEDVEALLIEVIRNSMGIVVRREDIDHAHRMSKGGSKIACRFAKCGPSSVRQRIYDNRIPPRGERPKLSLFVNESLSQNRQEAYLKLLELKKAGRIYTVYSRRGDVFFKDQRFGVSFRANSLAEVDRRINVSHGSRTGD